MSEQLSNEEFEILVIGHTKIRTTTKGIDVYAECGEVRDLKEYTGSLTLSMEKVPISFEFRIKFYPDLAEAADKSLSDYELFVDETDLDLGYRGAPVKLPRDVKAILVSFLGETSLEFARLPERTQWREAPATATNNVIRKIGREEMVRLLDESGALNGRGALGFGPFMLTYRTGRRIEYTPLEKFYQECLAHGLH